MKVRIMARSKKKTPFCGITYAASEKQDKRLANRIYRRGVKQNIQSRPFEFTHIDRREFRHNNVWSFAKDGKHYFGALEFCNAEYFTILNRK